MPSNKKLESSVHIPEEIWDQIFSKLGDERHLEPLSLVSKSFLAITNHHKQTLNLSSSTNPFARFPNLKHISFSKFPNNPLPILHQLAGLGLRLETLDLSHHKWLVLEDLVEEKLHSSSLLIGLKKFKMRGRDDLDDDVLSMIGKAFPNLEELDLGEELLFYEYDYHYRSRKSSTFSERGVSLLITALKSLRKINLSGRSLVSDKEVICFREDRVEIWR